MSPTPNFLLNEDKILCITQVMGERPFIKIYADNPQELKQQILSSLKLQRLIEEYLKDNPIDDCETYHDYVAGSQDGRNSVKEYILSFLEESKK